MTYIDERHKIIEAVTKNPLQIMTLEWKWRGDRTIVQICALRDARLFRYADSRLRSNREFVEELAKLQPKIRDFALPTS
ncbi:MAG: hypothetical protein A3F09_05640 [Chlamydiae bacterium RIFCSPHIGHO2_12_FULL_49_11]|nr:MAG: hypothetical protein A3F09_05640 [Chlamydiae bacterium RIFCSPHIGHO2_12_FULL_49_11]